MATSLDDIQPLELASIRDDAARAPAVDLARHRVRGVGGCRAGRRRHRRVGRRPCAARARTGPECGGRRVVGARRGVRGGAPTARATGRGDGVGGDDRRAGAARRGVAPGATWRPTPCATSAAGLRGVAVAFLPGVGLHLVLGLPDGSLRSRARRIWVGAGYAASVVVAIYLLDDRPHVALWPVVIIASADAVVGLVGYVARCRAAATVQERARLQWPAWAVVVAAAISVDGVGRCTSSLSWPEPLRAIVVSTTVLIPLALALGASERIAVRIDRLLVHTITLAGLPGWSAASYLLIVLGLGRAPDRRREDAARAVDARGRGRRAAVDPGARAPHRVRDTSRLRRAARARRGAAHLRQPPHPCAPARRAAAAARGVAEEDDVARASPRCGPAASAAARARGVGARPRPGHLALGSEEETVVARAGVSGPGVGAHLAAGDHAAPTTSRAAGRADHQLAASCSA